MERHLGEAEVLARALGDERRLGLALVGMVMPRMNMGDLDEAQRSQLGRFDEAIAQADVAVRIAEAADHRFSLCFILLDLGLSHLGRGDVPRAIRVLERCLDLCRT
jgi:hypothetical protein